MVNWEAGLRVATAATLAGLKPATLLCFPQRGDTEQSWNWGGCPTARSLGLEVRELRRSHRSIQVLFYRQGELAQLGPDDAGTEVLADLGYALEGSTEDLLDQLVARSSQGVPHEVGCFLGYPGADVRGFLRHRGSGGLLTGWWRVYDDVATARKRFAELQSARRDAQGQTELNLWTSPWAPSP